MRALIFLVALTTSGLALAQGGGLSRCNIDVTDIDFGQYSTLEPFDTLANGRVIVDCAGTGETPTRATVSAGNSGNQLNRSMSSGRQEILYNLYVDSARRIVAGDGTQGSSPLVPRLSRAERTLYFLFGAIPGEQPVEAGRYSDRLRIEVEF
jgi:spore coat protein U-like protein